MIEIRKVGEAGYDAAMLGLSLNKQQDPSRMHSVALKLAFADAGSHRKFLRQIGLWFYVNLPRYLWPEMDTYKVGMTRNSGSTMHNLHKERPHIGMFHNTPQEVVDLFACQWDKWQAEKLSLAEIKACLPEGFLQDSVLYFNYEVLRTMYHDRKNHRLPDWQVILNSMLEQVERPEFIVRA
jgi:hypothetical protein